MGKLVRDGIPDLIRASGREPRVRPLDPDAYVTALLDKVVEEATELRAASPSQRLEEMADVHEVLRSLASALGHTPQELETEADRKRSMRGGFEGRTWLDD